jgi:hypothetical protein
MKPKTIGARIPYDIDARQRGVSAGLRRSRGTSMGRRADAEQSPAGNGRAADILWPESVSTPFLDASSNAFVPRYPGKLRIVSVLDGVEKSHRSLLIAHKPARRSVVPGNAGTVKDRLGLSDALKEMTVVKRKRESKRKKAIDAEMTILEEGLRTVMRMGKPPRNGDDDPARGLFDDEGTGSPEGEAK